MSTFPEPPPPYSETPLDDENNDSTDSEPTPPEETECTLNVKQRMVVDKALRGHHVFITGAAGTGKSFVIKHLCKEFDDRNRVYRILAPTGVAAVNVSGMTIHRFLGIRPDVKTLSDYLRFCKFRSKVPWNTIQTIVIDEISMVHPKLFELFDEIARHHRRNSKPFGGIQMILLGDYFQLPPIQEKEDDEKDPVYVFETALWKRLNLETCVLDVLMRQTELEFIQALNDLRIGKFTKRVKRLVKKCAKNPKVPGMHYVKVFSLNVHKNYSNETELARIKTTPRTYHSIDVGDEKYLSGCRAEKTLTIKESCPVMLLWNLPEHNLCNGSIGIVTGYDGPTGLPIVKFNSGPEIVVLRQEWKVSERTPSGPRIIASRSQVPLALAFALTGHKTQGLTLDHMEADLKGVFTTGQLYVMLSRASTSQGLIVRNFKEDAIMTDERVKEFYRSLESPVPFPSSNEVCLE